MNLDAQFNPYTLPEGNVLISFSGGRTSGYMLHQILAVNGDLPERCKVVFCNTGREMPETLDFVQECSQRWREPVTWLEYRTVFNEKQNKNHHTFKVVNHNSASRNGEPFEVLIKARSTLPNNFQRFCTVEMKIRTIKRFLKSQGWKQWANVVGIRADERHRVSKSREKEWNNYYPLTNANQTKNHVANFWKQQPFDLKVTAGFGNCDGCFLKSEKNIAALWRLHPERAAWWANLEAMKHGKKEMVRSFHKNRTYKQIGDFVSRQGDWIFDDEAYLCQADDGECTG